MSLTDVEICNLALSRVRGGSIGSLTEQSPQAVQCNIIYAHLRDTLLTSYAWGFATTTRALSLTSGSPVEWLYEYDYPNDCWRIKYIVPRETIRNNNSGAIVPTPIFDYGPDPYEVATGTSGSRVIWTDREEAYINYTKAITDERLFDPLFTDAFAWLLSIDLAIPFGGDSGQRYQDRAISAFDQAIQRAISHSANESEEGGQRLPRNIQVRTGNATVRDVINGNPVYRRY